MGQIKILGSVTALLRYENTMRQPRDSSGFEIRQPSFRGAVDQGANNPWKAPVRGPRIGRNCQEIQYGHSGDSYAMHSPIVELKEVL